MPDSPAFALAQDPAYLAFLRASGLSDEIAAAAVARQSGAINQALGLNVEDLDESGRRQRRSISSSQESRGALRSGETLRRTSEQEQDQARRRAAIEQAAANQLGGLQTGLASQIAGTQLKGSELALGMSADRDLSTGQDAIDLAMTAPAAAPTPLTAASRTASSTTRRKATY